MKTFSTKIMINASANTVWNLLTDAPNWHTWNTTIDKIEGKIADGERVTVHAKISPGRAFPVKVAEFVPPERMVWKGGMPLGLFTGRRVFSITPLDNGNVEFAMEETFSGLMSPLISKSIPDLNPAFIEFAECLKKAAEGNQ